MTLTPTGKPRRALEALRDTTPDTAMSEYEVWRQLPYSPPVYGALRYLVEEGLAIRLDHSDCSRWYITDAGTALLAEQEGR